MSSDTEQHFWQKFDSFIGAYCAGAAAVIIGTPLDMVKVRLQVQTAVAPKYSGALDCVYKIMRHEGFMTFYKGAVFPLLAAGIMSSANVGLADRFKHMLSEAAEEETNSFRHAFVGGGIAGVLTSLIGTPFDHLRIRMQLLGRMNPVYNKTLSCTKYIFVNYGIKGLWKGLNPTVARNAVGQACTFGAYDLVKRNLFKDSQGGLLQPIISGSIAGMSFWALSYPLDSVKTRIQADCLQNPQYKGTIDCFVKTIKHEGYRPLFQGFATTMVRTIPTSAAFWTTYEFIKARLEQRRNQVKFQF